MRGRIERAVAYSVATFATGAMAFVLASTAGAQHTPNPQHPHGKKHDGHHQEKGKNPHGMKHSFADAERWAAIFDAESRDAWQKPEHVVELMAIERGMVVADIGAGTGYFLPHLAAAVGASGRVMGLEVEPAMVRHIQERVQSADWMNVEAHLIKHDDPGLGIATVDRILIVNTWHHIGDRGAYSRRLARALLPRGKVVIIDYTLESDDGPPKSFRLPPEQIISELEAGGLNAWVVKEDLPNQFVIMAMLEKVQD